jgi:hypothetical protein
MRIQQSIIITWNVESLKKLAMTIFIVTSEVIHSSLFSIRLSKWQNISGTRIHPMCSFYWR